MAIFGATVNQNPKLFQAGKAHANIGDMPVILLQVTIQISRNLSPIPTLTDGIIWSATPVQGALQADSILTKDYKLTTLLAGEGCDPLPIVLKMNGGECGEKSDITLSIADAYCSTLTFSMSGQNGYIAHGFTCSFTTCEIS